MPIRFRCAYCNQLMGISKRKAGQVVRCPKCAGEIIVPVPEGMQAPGDQPEEPAAGPAAFEDLNFEQHLHEPATGKNGATAATETAAAQPQPDVPTSAPGASAAAPPKRLGFFMSLGMLLVSLGVVILLLILVFLFGLIIGKAIALPP
jgi:DNA-directed RNA polymerase subunit RPC12/RpoP